MAGVIEIEENWEQKGSCLLFLSHCSCCGSSQIRDFKSFFFSFSFFPQIIRSQYGHFHDQEGNTVSNRKIIFTSASEG